MYKFERLSERLLKNCSEQSRIGAAIEFTVGLTGGCRLG